MALMSQLRLIRWIHLADQLHILALTQVEIFNNLCKLALPHYLIVMWLQYGQLIYGKTLVMEVGVVHQQLIVITIFFTVFLIQLMERLLLMKLG